MNNKIIEKYKLKDNVACSDLKNNNFRNNKCKIDLHNNLIYLIITVELNEYNDEENDNWWTYQVLNSDCNTLYIPYYNRLLGANELVKTLDKKINRIFSNMTDIFEPVQSKKSKKVKHNGQ